MKIFIIGLALTLLCLSSSAQREKTSFSNIEVVTTSAGLAAQLTWKKGTENISYFIVERSTDGIDYKKCGIMFLSEDPEFNEYQFRDKIGNNTSGLSYRIGIVTDKKRLHYLPAKKIIVAESL